MTKNEKSATGSRKAGFLGRDDTWLDCIIQGVHFSEQVLVTYLPARCLEVVELKCPRGVKLIDGPMSRPITKTTWGPHGHSAFGEIQQRTPKSVIISKWSVVEAAGWAF